MKKEQQNNKVTSTQIDNHKAPVNVLYRLEGKKHLGKGAFFDHYTVQRHTGYPTVLLADIEADTSQISHYISTQTNNLPYSPNNGHNRPTPNVQYDINQGGLLYIPGITRESYEKNPLIHQKRIVFDKKAIKTALNRGRPILAVCAGTWTLWESLGGEIKSVADHNYGGGMPRISNSGKITYNKHVHNVEVNPTSLLHKTLAAPADGTFTMPVNSIHWMAPSNHKVPSNFEICATAKKNPDIHILKRQSVKMAPEENTVEGFCSISGAPVIGVLWHPEGTAAKINNPNSQLLLYMAQAGTAYERKQRMLKEFKKNVEDEQLVKLTNSLKI